MGSANTPEKVMKIYRQLNLSQSSLYLTEIPKRCTVLTFDAIYETCMKHFNMIVIGVYKRQVDENVNV